MGRGGRKDVMGSWTENKNFSGNFLDESPVNRQVAAGPNGEGRKKREDGK